MFLFRLQMKRFIAATDIIFCQTSVVQKRVSQSYSFPIEKTSLCGFAVPLEILNSTKSDIPSVFDKTSGKFYFLLLTRYMPHRNPRVLILLCKKYGDIFREQGIVFITTVKPEDNQASRQFIKEIDTKNLQDLIVNVGVLSREQVAVYLRAADALWLPTLMECMATPYLEAMTLEVPILAPNIDCATYVCDDAALYYDPWDVDSIFEAIKLLRNDQALRDKLVKNGKIQIANEQKFPHDWNEVANKILTQLRNIAKK